MPNSSRRDGRSNRWHVLGLAVCTGLVLSACGGKPTPPGARHLSPSQQYEQAVVLMDKGQCTEAVPIFTALSKVGRGWELAQVNLADCLMRMAETAGPAKAPDLEAQAIGWLMLAANSNEPRAQARLALAYAEGRGLPLNGVEAAKWYALATRPTLEAVVDVQEYPEGFETRVRRGVSEADWQTGTALAAAWNPDYQDLNADLIKEDPRWRRARQQQEQQQRVIRRR